MRNLLFLLLLPFFSCNDESLDCPDNIACTEQFEIILVKISDSQGSPVQLDNYFTVDLQSDEIYDFQSQDTYLDSILRVNGNYILFTDGQMDKINKSGTRFSFKGFINSTEVVSEKFLIGHDCCHVVLLEGNTEIILN